MKYIADPQKIRALSLRRQHLISPVSADDYLALFRQMSPVQTVYWSAPGNPPCLTHRAAFDDSALCYTLRRDRVLLKGRFQGGGIAYVHVDDLELYGTAYRKEGALTHKETEMLELIEQEGPLNIAAIKEFTGMTVKAITPILHKLQEKFLVFEDQETNDGDRGWYIFASEFPDIDLTRRTKLDAIGEILTRYTRLCGFITPEMARSFYKFPVRVLADALASLTQAGILTEAECGGDGFVLTDDIDTIEAEIPVMPDKVLLMHRSDFLVRSYETQLKREFDPDEHDILYYILIQGELAGAVIGHFRFTPDDVEDVLLRPDIPRTDTLYERIVAAVATRFDPAVSPLKRYCGKELKKV